MSEEMKGTTRYLDATVMEYALLCLWSNKRVQRHHQI